MRPTPVIFEGGCGGRPGGGYRFSFGAEMEFYLFKTDEHGEPTREPYDHAGYMDIAPDDRGENIRREICLTLEQMGIRPESSHHEEGPGQNEIDFRYSDPLTAADNAVTFRSVVQTIAAPQRALGGFLSQATERRARQRAAYQSLRPRRCGHRAAGHRGTAAARL